MIDARRYVAFLIEHQLSPSQFLFLYLLLFDEIALLYQYCAEFQAFTRKELVELQDKGFAICTVEDKNSVLYADAFEVTDKFRELLFSKHPEEMFEELWNKYPNFHSHYSKRTPTKACNKEELREDYVKLIRRNRPLHNSIITSVEWGKQRGYLNLGITQFIEGRRWEEILLERKRSVERGEVLMQYD
ncbi:MAG: hypothetical protein CMC08_09585 [Flavobacteriaceae bacterium]|nr:hypothetical protein [Flavobacteriaceae bacterium]|tara:strand:+ start:688 stop:1251 length:564 start_codon:yes stop_codon:yes gene_type:complete